MAIATAASNRNRSALGWFLFTALFSWLLAGIVRLVVGDNYGAKSNERDDDENAMYRRSVREKHEREEAAKKAREAEARRKEEAARQEQLANRVTGTERLKAFQNIRQLRDRGLLSNDEFTARKAKTIDGLSSRLLGEHADTVLSALIPLVDDGTLTDYEIAVVKAAVYRAESA